ncbi:Prenylcysteine oxidase [Penicillium macrosclerotiorum]|uniref:Prenylcysteine oxidase n=1 Tax=Penicillium macrosclerotiorum TaxID=303699 RepID=UPI002546F3D3|nr:Prenylcysteine oxidase [Penicillium macrosclerotiorum]KAJ5693037.1 Prenylcysteine oxidase [Penicillium macrosclerotiorum]
MSRSLWLLCTILSYFVSLSNATQQRQQQPLQSAIDAAPKRVAVIGAGAGGSFAAYELRKLADQAGVPINITVFERASYIGGRSTTVDVFDNPAYPIELGASIFVQINHNLVNASRDLGLTVRNADHARPRETDDSIGIWDGEQFVFTLKNTYSWWNIGRLFWRYGLAPLRTQNAMKAVVGRFLRLYEEPLFPFKSLSEAAEAVELLNATRSTGEEFLKWNQIDPRFSREIIQASTRVNYGQNLPLIHGLESMVCMATDGAVSIDGGNWQIFDGALKASQADIKLNTTVTEIVRTDDAVLHIISHPSDELEFSQPIEKNEFDEVVIAGPLQYSGMSISPPLDRIPDEIPFVKLHVTLLSSPHRLSPRFFGLEGRNVRAPETVLTTLPEGFDIGQNPHGVGPAEFWSISTLRTVKHTVERDGEQHEEEHYVYKIFSPERPTAKFVAEMLGIEYSDGAGSVVVPQGNTSIEDLPKSEISWFHEKLWHPYPLLYPRVTFEETHLAPGVWYTSGIESFISTMETSALMGRNVAALMVQSWQKQKEQMSNDGLSTASSSKLEL